MPKRGTTQKRIFVAGVSLCLVVVSTAAANDVWPRPEIVPLPAHTQGVANPVLSLNGAWKFSMSPPAEFWLDSADPSAWPDITVPGEPVVQGFKISRNTEYPYKKSVLIPPDFSGKRILLRFDGVYSYARVWVNGKFVRDHHGGFTSWDCDLTGLVTPGQVAWITVGVTDMSDEISFGSNYAKHYLGGILRDVKLVALPENYLTRLQVETDFDPSYTDARLKVTAGMALHGAGSASVNLRLKDTQDREVPLQPSSISLNPGAPQGSLDLPLKAPQKWDAEHPSLYTLEASVVVGGSEVETVLKKVGFRKIAIQGNMLLVNGKEVKLRGGCRHDVHPLRGRTTTAELDERDVVLLRNANLNFIRTSHYPPTEKFLESCDRYGMYVEEETAVCFVNQSWSMDSTASQSDPRYTARYMNQFAEMMERDKSHPSVIIWSLGNESRWGSNFAKEYAYVKREDTTRPVIFSYPEQVPKGTPGYDIVSVHYPRVDGDLRSGGIPKLNDEYGHVACYNLATLKRDPGVRNFWGESLKRFWENCFTSAGCLGGAIWATIDEVFMLPDSPVGYGEWGIVDGWRRPKPEYWLTQKAYSPVRIVDAPVANPGAGQPLRIPVRNWFDHTDLSELAVVWSVGAESGKIESLSVSPHAQGMLTIPARRWENGEILDLKFYRAGDILVDEYKLPVGRASRVFPAPRGPAPKVTADANSITVSGSDFTIVFSKATGLITEGTYHGTPILESGPYLNLGAVSLPSWWLASISSSTTDEEAVVTLAGSYMALHGGESDTVNAKFEVRIDGQGLITTSYSIANPPKGLREVGVAYVLSRAVEQLTWERKGLWSAYPAGHIGRVSGLARKVRSGEPEPYRSEPAWAWSVDTRDFFLSGREGPGSGATNDFRSLKENIWHASCLLAGTNIRVRAESDATAAVRAEVLEDGHVRFNIDNLWDYPDLGWGNSQKPISLSSPYSNRVRMRLTDNDNYEVRFETAAAEKSR
jgi:beta-galactosidase/beta-glucuronidase